MTKSKENAVPSVATTENGTGTKQGGQAVVIPTTDYIRSGAARQGWIEGLLLHGRANAISTRDLLSMTGISSARLLRRKIREEREHGALILSTTAGGYFLPSEGEEGQRELQIFIASLSARAANTFKAVTSARAALKVDVGQTGLKESIKDGKTENG